MIVNHCLLGLPGVQKEELKRVLSHPQVSCFISWILICYLFLLLLFQSHKTLKIVVWNEYSNGKNYLTQDRENSEYYSPLLHFNGVSILFFQIDPI